MSHIGIRRLGVTCLTGDLRQSVHGVDQTLIVPQVAAPLDPAVDAPFEADEGIEPIGFSRRAQCRGVDYRHDQRRFLWPVFIPTVLDERLDRSFDVVPPGFERSRLDGRGVLQFDAVPGGESHLHLHCFGWFR